VTTRTVLAPTALPTKSDEAWRYAPHALLRDLTFGAPADPSTTVHTIDDLLPPTAGHCVVIVGGVVDSERSNLADIAGVRVSTLRDAIEQNHPLASAHLHATGVGDAFTAANVEFGLDGAVIEIDPQVAVASPIHVIDVAHPRPGCNASSTGVVVHLGAGSTATIVETRLGVDVGFGGSNVRTTVTLDEAASLEHVTVQDLPADQVHLGRVEVAQAAASTYRSRTFNIGAAYGRLALHVDLQGTGAAAELAGLYFGTGEQTLDQQITVVHAVEGATSRQAFRGVLDDRSVGVFNGGIVVRPGADGSDAAQTNANLLLSDRAEVNTQPRLEILADEVRCTHGATVGQLDDEALYYLRSRGIGADAARRLLVDAFADQVVDTVSDDGVRAWIANRIGHHGHA
jgi:Fe-S cluster assembly protein SufD